MYILALKRVKINRMGTYVYVYVLNPKLMSRYEYRDK